MRTELNIVRVNWDNVYWPKILSEEYYVKYCEWKYRIKNCDSGEYQDKHQESSCDNES